MLDLGELCLFLTEDVYLIKNDILGTIVHSAEEPEQELEEQIEQKVPEPIVQKKEPIKYKSILFVFDTELTGLSKETFNNLVSKGLALSENDYSAITQEQVSFSKPEEVNSKKVILFDVSFSGYQNKYKLFHSNNQLVLLADSMEKIAANTDLKRQLWAQLQLMFPKTV